MMAMLGIFNQHSVKRQRGFTLLEVMVALGIVAVGLAAAVTSVTAGVRNASGLQQRTFAHWVAMNQLAKIQITGSKIPSTKRGSEPMAGHEWYWRIELEPTADDAFKYVDVSVRANEEDEEPVVTVRGMVSVGN
jgi:general secretion pathway protein I